jgi:hypothetical protein
MSDSSIDIDINEILQEPIEVVEPPFNDVRVTETRKEAMRIFDLEDKSEEINKAKDLLNINLVNTPIQKIIEDPTKNDKLVQSIKNDDPGATILNNIMLEFAEEIAYMKAWRNNNFQIDKDMTSEVSEKRIKALNSLTTAVIEKLKIASTINKGKIDFYSENFSKIFEYFIKIVQETFQKVGIPEQFRNIYFAELSKQLDGFEKVAEKIYSGKVEKINNKKKS